MTLGFPASKNTDIARAWRGPPRLPAHAPGLRIGLFGGSFNPPHGGHRLASLTALARLRLDAVWWLVTPGNPLKANRDLPPIEARVAAARRLARHPRIHVSGVEADLQTRYSFDTLRALQMRCPGVHFVWIMGADNLAGLHRWQHWTRLVDLMPMAIIDRPGSTLKAVASRAGQRLAGRRVPESDAALLPDLQAPAWVFVHGRRSDLSSTMLRAENSGTARHGGEN